MSKAKYVSMGVFLLVGIVGCIQMRDYTGVKNGAFGLNVKKSFGEGKEKKDYYVIKGGEGIVIGDTKKEIIALIGLPDKVSTTLEGYECWVYEERKIELLFHEGRLKDWQQL